MGYPEEFYEGVGSEKWKRELRESEREWNKEHHPLTQLNKMEGELTKAKHLIWNALQGGCTTHWREKAQDWLGSWNPY